MLLKRSIRSIKFWVKYQGRCLSASPTKFEPKICIVGSGPAGFYTAQGLLKAVPEAQVDIFEKLPVPYGLVRYGVAPDHPEVKNAINIFLTTSRKGGFRFFGNVNIGFDLTLEQLRSAYHAIVFCTGAENDNKFGIPGEDLKNVLSARRFVGWYNGFPEDSKLDVNLDSETVAIFGQGNVALDVARIILTDVNKLKSTDVTQYALEKLSKSRVKRVILIGRRGPLQVSFTIKELRELFALSGCQGAILKQDVSHIDGTILEGLERPRRRLTELMLKNSIDSVNTGSQKRWELSFLRSPVEFLQSSHGSLSGVQLCVNRLEFPGSKPISVSTGNFETIECQLAFRSIGYRSKVVDPSLPYDSLAGVISNVNGKVNDRPGIYCSGWAALGPVGVIVTTMNDSFLLSNAISKDIKSGSLHVDEPKCGREGILKLLKDKNVQVVEFEDWLRIDEEEQRRGSVLGKPREKIANIEELLSIAGRLAK